MGNMSFRHARHVKLLPPSLISLPFYLLVSGAAAAGTTGSATSPPNEKDESPPLRGPKDSSGKAAAAAGIPAQAAAATAAPGRPVGAHGAKKKPSKESEPVGNTCQRQREKNNNEGEEEDDERPVEDRHKLVPEGNDFKLVFISSDSSKESGKCSDEVGWTSAVSLSFGYSYLFWHVVWRFIFVRESPWWISLFSDPFLVGQR